MKLDKKFIFNAVFAIALFFSVMFLFESPQYAVGILAYSTIYNAAKVFCVVSIVALAVLIALDIILAFGGGSKKRKIILTIVISVCLLIILTYLVVGLVLRGNAIWGRDTYYDSIIVSIIPMFVAAGVLSGIASFSAFSKKTTESQ